MPFTIIAGPCTVESQEQITAIAAFLQSCGMTWIKGGGYKPFTWGPAWRHSYQRCLGTEGIRLLRQAAEKYGLSSLTEDLFPDLSTADWMSRVQVGARNMQNFRLLEELNEYGVPILLKRHFGCSLTELYAATTYLPRCDVWVCERGVVVPHQHGYRYLLDFQGILEWKRTRTIPIFVDISHWMGVEWARHNHDDEKCLMIVGMAKLAKTAGADGILVDVHHQPDQAWTDPFQALNFRQFESLLKALHD